MNKGDKSEDNNHVEPFGEKELSQKEEPDIKLILDIPLELHVELGKTRMLVNDLLQLGQGSIVDLNKSAGEPLDIWVHGKLIASGEVVVVDEKYGIRVTDIASPHERVKSLK